MSLNCTVTELATPSHRPALCPCCTGYLLHLVLRRSSLDAGAVDLPLVCFRAHALPKRHTANPFKALRTQDPSVSGHPFLGMSGHPFLLLTTLQVLFEFGGRSYAWKKKT